MKTLNIFLIILPILTHTAFAKNAQHPTSDSLKTYWLSEIVVTAPKALRENALPVKEIQGNDIRQLSISDASQALLLVPSLYLSTSAKSQTTFRLRGIDQRQISVFLDGIPISVPFNGIVDLSQFVGDNVAKIHVASSVSSVLFGTNNIGGSVNIITEEPPRSQRLKLRMEHNPAGYFFNSISYGGTSGHLLYSASVNFNKSANFLLPDKTPSMPNEDGGRRNHSSYTKMNAFVKLRYVLSSNHRIGLLFNHINNTYDIPPNALSQRPRFWRFPFWQRSLFSFNTQHAFKHFLLRSVWYFDAYRNKLQSYDDASYSTQNRRYAFTSVYDDHSLGANLLPEMRLFPFGKTLGLLSFKRDVHREKSKAAHFDEFAMHTISLGLEQNLHLWPGITAQLSGDANWLQPVKAQNYPVRKGIALFNAQFAIRYAINHHWDIHLASGQKSRFPTLKELYSEYLGRNIANPNLKPEHGFNNELGLNLRGKSWLMSGNVFFNRLWNLITPVWVDKNISQMQNIGQALFYGAELEYRQKWQLLNLVTRYTFLQASNQSHNRTSRHLEYRPQQQFFMLLTYAPVSHWMFETDLRAYAGQYYQNPDNLTWAKLNDYALVGAKLQFRWNEKFACYLRATNLFDRFYYSEWGVPMPGRQFILGFQAQL